MKQSRPRIKPFKNIVGAWLDMIDTACEALMHIALVPVITVVWLLLYIWLPAKDRP